MTLQVAFNVETESIPQDMVLQVDTVADHSYPQIHAGGDTILQNEQVRIIMMITQSI